MLIGQIKRFSGTFWVAVGLLVGTLLSRLLVLMMTGDPHVETFEYEVIADNLLAGLGYGIHHYGTWYKTFGSPPFAYLCALVYRIFCHSHSLILAIQACFSVVTVLGCYGLGRRLFSPTVGLLAAILVALHPGFLFYDTHKIHPLSFDVALATSGILMVLRLKEQFSWRSLIQVGLLHGLAIFERSTFVGLIPLAFASTWRLRKERPFLRFAVLYLVSVTAVLSPWVVRNLFLYRQPVLVTTTSAEVFWRGNNPVASGGGFASGKPGVPVFTAAPETFQMSVVGKSELIQSQIFLQTAIEYIVKNPSQALRLYAKKWLAFWWFSPHSGYLYPLDYLIFYKVYYAVVLGFALLGMGIAFQEKERRWDLMGIIIFMISVAFLQAAFYVEIRHRWGIEPLLLIFAAKGAGDVVCFLVNLLRSQRCSRYNMTIQ